MAKTRFSVLIPVYNRAACVRECIDSILAQTFPDYEIIAIDDGSTDGTQEVLRSYGDRIKVLKQDNQGPEIARNLGAVHAGGEYLAFLDSDDLICPWTLATYDRVIEACESPALIIGVLLPFRADRGEKAAWGSSARIEAFRYRDYLSKDIPVDLSCSNIVVKSSCFRLAGGHRLSSPKTFHADEHDFVLRVGTCGPCVILRRPDTVAYRLHDGNAVRDVALMADGVLSLVRAERRGQYPGGPPRRLARYSVIGGMAHTWIRRALAAGCYRLALKMLVSAGSMLMVGALNKLGRTVRRRPASSIFVEKQGA